MTTLDNGIVIDESITADHLAGLNKIRRERDNDAVKSALEALRNGAKDPNVNTMPLLIDCVRAYASVGEISDALRDVFGTYQEPALF